MTGSGSEEGSIRLCRTKDADSDTGDVFLIPCSNIEQIFVISNTAAASTEDSDAIFQVIIVPSAAAGSSAAKREYPQIISFSWPNCAADEKLTAHFNKDAEKPENETYLTSLVKVLNEQLGAFEKSVIIAVDSEATTPLRFICLGHFSESSIMTDTSATEQDPGSLYFLCTGILWVSDTIFYFPLRSLKKFAAIFNRDSSEGQGMPVVAMSLMCSVSEPFYEAQGGPVMSKLMLFKNIKQYVAVIKDIERYCSDYSLKLDKIEQHWYNYAEGAMMTGFMPLTVDIGVQQE